MNQRRASLRIYKSLEILTIMFNNCVRDFALPLSSIFVCSVQTISLYVCIKFHAGLHFQFLAAFATCAGSAFMYELVSLPLFGKLFGSSEDFLRGQTGNMDMSKEWRKTKGGMRVLRVSTSHCFTMDRQTVLTFISLVITTTANLLVST